MKIVRRVRWWLDMRRVRRDLARARAAGQVLLSTGRGLDSPERGVLLR